MTITYPSQRIARFLSDDGTNTGTKSLLGDHTAGVDFWIEPAAGITYLIDKMVVTIEDVGVMTSNLYGGIAALTTGVELWIKDTNDVVLAAMDDSVNIKTNGDWISLADQVFIDYLAAVASHTHYLLHFENPILLADGEKLGVTFNDDLAGLVAHRIFVTGIASSAAGAPDPDILS